jgi:ATP-binding cassette, subfamily C, bacterial
VQFFNKGKCYTPTVLQMEATECGAAALAMILGYYGRHVPLAKLRQDCGVSRDGSKASNIVKAAKLHGCKAKGLGKPASQLKDLKLPAIIFWKFNHFVTLERFSNGFAHINDPGLGHRKVGMAEFEASYSGVVLIIEPDKDFQKGGERLKALPSLLGTLRGNMEALMFSLLTGLVLVVPGMALPVATSVFIDSVLIEQRTDWFRPLLIFMIGTLFLKLTLSFLQVHVSRRFSLAMLAKLNSGFIRHLFRLPISFYTQRFPGEVVNRTSLNDEIAETVTGPVTSIGVDIVKMFLYGGVLMFFNPGLTLIGIGLLLVNFLVLAYVSSAREEATLSSSQEMGRVHGTLIAGIQGIETIKAGGQENTFYNRWGGFYARGMNSTQRLQKTSMSIGVLPDLMEDVTGVIILLLGGLQVMSGDMTIGMLTAFNSLMGNFQAPVGNLFGFATRLQELRASLVRVQDVLNNKPVTEPSDKMIYTEEGEPLVRCRGLIDLNNIQFGFNPAAPPLIKDFSLHITPGQSVALVGGSGSGKSTIAKILCGLYEPQGGSVKIDGKSINELPKLVKRNTLGLVEQDIGIFEGKIRDNLTLWDSTVPDSVIIDACRTAEILDIVQSMPGGLDAELLENGSNLSGGQRQRIELARALVNNPSIIVLDEATSALDAETERRITVNLRRRRCTSIIVAHRLSTIRDADEIIVLKTGDVIERGSHNELIEKRSHYWQLVQKSIDKGEDS